MKLPLRLPTCLALLVMLFGASGCTRSSSPAPAYSPSADPPPVWLAQELKVEGMTIALGYRRSDAATGRNIQPLTAITKDGAAVPDAMVFHQLVSADGKTSLSDEVATVFTTASENQPGRYGQGKLSLPQEETPLAIRYRIVFADVEQPFTKDVPLPTFPAKAP